MALPLSDLFPALFFPSSPLPWEIKFPCGSLICCTARWFIRDAKSMQKQSLLHPFPACQPGSCWLFIKGAAQVRRMHPDALIDCLLPCGDSSWMDWTVGGKEGERKALTPSLPLSETLLQTRPVSFLPHHSSCAHTRRLLTLTGLQPVDWLNAWKMESHPEHLNTIIYMHCKHILLQASVKQIVL